LQKAKNKNAQKSESFRMFSRSEGEAVEGRMLEIAPLDTPSFYTLRYTGSGASVSGLPTSDF
jgi:hypothetical protein